ncbi:hypothetical protein QBC47DRAFT_458713 [Echria macrotheca]|uniref:RNA-binding protein n=1 Tax=Echria macrotheca TaxID=438768 RepID=A0AAJ0BHX8_9PEZI|nr:hypothetical protein QBC47DRAFT_458713 [Echria macrotheca]
MYEDYRSTRDDRSYHRSPPRRADSRDGDYRRSRKDVQSYHAHQRTLDYDDHDEPPSTTAARYSGRRRSRSPAGGARDEKDGYRGDDRRGGGGGDGGYYGSRERRYSADRRRDGSRSGGRGPPSRSIVLHDVPEDAKERDILYGLGYVTRDRHFSDQIKVARLRHDHNGRRIAYVEFHRRSDAEYFIDRYYPEISFPLEQSRGVDSEPVAFGISFSKSGEDSGRRESRRDDEDWDCYSCGAVNYPHRAACFKCRAERPGTEDDGYGQGHARILTGETDADPQQMPSQYVVIRDLEPSVTEQVLANGVMKLFLESNSDRSKEAPTSTNKLKSTAPTSGTAGLGARPGSLRRVFLMRDRRSNDSWRYGFAEFATVEDAKGAVAKFRASAKFTIASKPVFVAFIHTGVFVPVLEPDPSQDPKFTFNPIYNPALQLKYWDERAYPSLLVVSADPTLDETAEKGAKDDAGKGASKNAAAKKVKKDKDPAAAAANKAIAMMPQMQMWAKKSAELHGLKKKLAEAQAAAAEEEAPVPMVIQREDLEAEPDEPLHPHWTDSYQSYADWDRVACLLCDWEVPSQEAIDERGYPQYRREDILIEHEVRVHNHYKDAETKDKAAAKLSAMGKQPREVTRRTPRVQSEAPPVYISYADFDALRCHLCRRTFKHAQTVWRHEQESELHKRMLADGRNKERATAELRAKGKASYVMVPNAQAVQMQSRYRDRASERRQAFRQPRKPGIVPQQQQRTAEKRKSELREEGAGDDEGAAKKSRGAGMLAKMGWTAGVGLGAEGAGRTEAIATDVYVPGVGLGAEGGRLGDANEEAARKTRGDFRGFVEKTRERARERWERLG